MASTLRTAVLAAAVLVALPLAGYAPATAAPAPEPALGLQVVGTRADLVSAGDALIEVVLPKGVAAKGLRVDDDGRDVTRAFSVRPGGRLLGLVKGLSLG